MRWPVIDTHFHLGINPLIHHTPDDLKRWMVDGGVDIQIVFQVNEGFVHKTPSWNPYIGNDFIADTQRAMPGRLIGLGMVNPYHQPPQPASGNSSRLRVVTRNPVLEELDRIIGELGLSGLKMHPYESHFQFNNPRIIFPIMERLVKLQDEVGRRLMIVTHAAGDSMNNSPEAIADTARRFPSLLFIAAHAGYKWGVPTIGQTLAREPNVLLDLTTFATTGALEHIYDEYGPARFSAGSDGPFATNRVKNAIVSSLTKGDAEASALILGGNVAKYLGLAKVEG
jgi:hypothetical protein